MDSKLSITLLNESNYATWKIQVKMNLIKEDLYGFITGCEKTPKTDDSSATHNFEKRRDKCLAVIVLSIDPKLLYIVGDPTDPLVVWNQLQNTFQRKTWSNKLRLRRQLYSMKLNEGGSLRVHLKSLIELFGELAVVGDAIGDEDKVINLLASLPDEYSTLVTALEALDQVPSWDVVTEKLMHMQDKVKTKEEETALITAKKQVQCYFCKKVGHIKRNCFKYQAELARNNASAAVVKEDIRDSECTLLVTNDNMNIHSWVIDSGATQHMCYDKSMFSYIESNGMPPLQVKVGDGRALRVEGKGSITLKSNLPGQKIGVFELHDVLYVPLLSFNLVSVSQATNNGKLCKFNNDICEIFDKNNLVAIGKNRNKLYRIDCIANVVFSQTKKINDDLWHQRLCHLGVDNMYKLNNCRMVEGFDCNFSNERLFCEGCCEGKSHRQPFPKNSSRKQSQPFELIHSDVCGKITPQSSGSNSYFLTFIDDCTHFTWVYAIKTKDQVFTCFTEWKALVENQFTTKIKSLRTDNGGEYISNKFQSFLKKEGIKHERTVPKSPEQNGVAERMNRTLLEAIRSMISSSHLSKSFWAEALRTAVYVRNRCPTSTLVNKTPYEALYNCKPNVKHFRVFGCICFSHISKDDRLKLDKKSKKCIFLGYDSNIKGYRLYDLTDRKVIIRRDVIFNENINISDVNDCKSDDNIDNSENVVDIFIDNDYGDDSVVSDISPILRRSNRLRRKPDRYGEYSNICELHDPLSVSEALNSSDSHLWKDAMKSEMDAMYDNDVWSLVELPKDRVPIKSKWVFKRKIGSDGSISRYKCRLVAQGFSQSFGVDYEETFSPVVRFETVRTLLSISASKNMEVHHMDVSSAFLNGDLSETIYMKQPECFVVSGKEELVCKLNKSIYGLKQSPRCWNMSLDNFLKSLGYNKCESDPCLYSLVNESSEIYVAVYVDDILISSKDCNKINELKNKLSNRYKMKDLGHLNYFLGVNVEQSVVNSKICLNQEVYVNALLLKYGMSDCKPSKNPIDPSIKFVVSNENSKDFSKEIYQSAIGSLLYLSMRTRPDIAFAVSKLSRYSSSPTQQHWLGVKHVFRYLKGTASYGLTYGKTNSDKCVGYSDADWAGDLNDRKSTSGYCFYLNGGLISWKSSKQPCVSLSTAEAEYVALALASQEAIWISKLLSDLGCYQSPIVIKEDNQAAICISSNECDHSRTKHIDIKFHYVRELVLNKFIELLYCPTDKMLADIFTKGLGQNKFDKLVTLINVNNRASL